MTSTAARWVAAPFGVFELRPGRKAILHPSRKEHDYTVAEIRVYACHGCAGYRVGWEFVSAQDAADLIKAIESEANTTHLYTPQAAMARRIMPCRTCKRSRRCVCFMLLWHRNSCVCTGCGEDPRDTPARFSKITWRRREKIGRAQRYWSAALPWRAAQKEFKRMLNDDTRSERAWQLEVGTNA